MIPYGDAPRAEELLRPRCREARHCAPGRAPVAAGSTRRERVHHPRYTASPPAVVETGEGGGHVLRVTHLFGACERHPDGATLDDVVLMLHEASHGSQRTTRGGRLAQLLMEE